MLAAWRFDRGAPQSRRARHQGDQMVLFDRRTVLAGMALFGQGSPAASFDWQPAAPADFGFEPDLEARLDRLIADRRAWGLHGVLVVRGRRIVLERYFAGEENN